jgi:hypothetical protein
VGGSVSTGGGAGQGVCVIFNDKEQLLQTKEIL